MEMMNRTTNVEPTDSSWESLYKVGGTAALIMALFNLNNHIVNP